MADITAVARASIQSFYGGAQPSSVDDVWQRYHTAQGMLMLWSDICFSMGTTRLINVTAQNELKSLIADLDNVARRRIGMPLVGQ